jgi:4a-hydroxytetrahydrobiopterin dehydratase
MGREEAERLLGQVSGWDLAWGKQPLLRKQFRFEGFTEAINFINAVARVADEQNHHPDIHIAYSRVVLEFTTHAIGGLSENDFIMAAHIDAL